VIVSSLQVREQNLLPSGNRHLGYVTHYLGSLSRHILCYCADRDLDNRDVRFRDLLSGDDVRCRNDDIDSFIRFEQKAGRRDERQPRR